MSFNLHTYERVWFLGGHVMPMFPYPWNSDEVEKRDGAYCWSIPAICPYSCLMSINHSQTHTQPLTFCHIRVFNLRQSTALLTRGRCKTHHPNSLKLSGDFLSTRQHWKCCYKYYDLSKLFYAQSRMSAKL